MLKNTIYRSAIVLILHIFLRFHMDACSKKLFINLSFIDPEKPTKLPIIPQKAGYTKVPLLVIKIA